MDSLSSGYKGKVTQCFFAFNFIVRGFLAVQVDGSNASS